MEEGGQSKSNQKGLGRAVRQKAIKSDGERVSQKVPKSNREEVSQNTAKVRRLEGFSIFALSALCRCAVHSTISS